MSTPVHSLGFGLGLRPQHYEALLGEHRGSVSWLEALTDNYLVPGGRPLHYLERLRAHYPVVLHGVSLSIGSTDPLNLDYLRSVKALADRDRARVDLRSPVLDRRRRRQPARPDAAAVHRGDRAARRQPRARRAGRARPPAGAGERLQLRQLRRRRDDRMGIPARDRRARRLPAAARRQQRLRQQRQPRLRPARLSARRAGRARAAVPSRRPPATRATI